jgi:hypothetical protein
MTLILYIFHNEIIVFGCMLCNYFRWFFKSAEFELIHSC